MIILGDIMLVNSKELLETAKIEKRAVMQFNINNLEWTKFILEQCQEMNAPVILGVSEGAAKYMGGYKTITMMVQGLIENLNITVPVVTHLDHGSSYESCKKAIDSGFTSVMIDCSKLPFEENKRITKEVVEYAKANNVTVETELGRVGGDEDGVAAEIYYADVNECEELYKATQIDSMAPALGSVHGFYKGEPKLNFERMQEISQKLNIPLVLHGGSGIPYDLVNKAIDNGICKLNVNTELQSVWNKALRGFIQENEAVYDPRKIISSGEKAIKEKVKEYLNTFYFRHQ